jgi:rubrerythrin
MKKSELIMMAKKIFLNENKLNELFAKSHTSKDKQILRTAIIAEFDAVNLYEQLSELAESKKNQASTIGHCKRRKDSYWRI